MGQPRMELWFLVAIGVIAVIVVIFFIFLRGVFSVEEQYEIKERKGLSISTTEATHKIVTSEPKVAMCIINGCDAQVDTKPITIDSPPIFDKNALTFTLKGVETTIYAKAVSGSGTLYIVVMK